MSVNDWKLLEFPDKEELAKARKQYHQAIQNVASVGRSFLPEDPGDIYGNLDWDANLQRLVGRWIEGDMIFRSSFSMSEFTVYLVDELFQTISSYPLQGKKQIDVMIWLEEQIDMLGLDSSGLTLKAPYDIPEYPTAKNEAFNLDGQVAGKELQAWFHNANRILRDITCNIDGASEVKCWPHHFDIASLITLLDTGDPETSKSINAGMSPGDGNYNEPYFYVSPWPYPVEELPDISDTLGFWHEKNWIGAILTYSNLSAVGNSDQQQEIVTNFFERGIQLCKGLLGH